MTPGRSRPWPDPELDTASPWPPRRIPSRLLVASMLGALAGVSLLVGTPLLLL